MSVTAKTVWSVIATLVMIGTIRYIVNATVQTQTEPNNKQTYLQIVEKNYPDDPAIICAYDKMIDKYGTKAMMNMDAQTGKGELAENDTMLLDTVDAYQQCSGEQI